MFDGARVKVERANKHIDEFEKGLQAFLDSRPYAIPIDGRREMSYSFVMTRRIPLDVMAVAGDAIHNLRAALDHCIWALWTNDTAPDLQTNDWTRALYFPSSGVGQQDYENQISSMVTRAGGSADAVALLRRLASYPGGTHPNSPLYRLNRLDIEDKHHIFVPTMYSAKISGLIEVTKTEDDQTIVVPLSDRTVMLEPDYPTYNALYPAGANFVGSYSQSPYSPKLNFSEDHKVSLEVHFAKDQPFPGVPITRSLLLLSEIVGDVIHQFEVMIAARP